MRKKVLKIGILTVIILNTFLFIAHSFVEVENDKNIKWKNLYEYPGNNIVIAKNNGILTFPFVLGQRLYLYDLKKDQFKLVAFNLNPLEFYSGNYCYYSNKVLYRIGCMDQGIEIFQNQFQNPWHKKKILSWCGVYTIYKDKILFMRDEEWSCQKNSIYIKDLKSGKSEKVFIKGTFSRFLRGKQEHLLTYDEKAGRIVEINMKNRKITYLLKIKEPIWAGEVGNTGIVFKYNKIIKFDKRSLVQEEICKVKGHVEIEDIRIKNKNLFYINDIGKLYCVNIESGVRKLITEIPYKKFTENSNFTIHYAKDFIAVHVFYKKGLFRKEKIMIYDYDGKLVKVKS